MFIFQQEESDSKSYNDGYQEEYLQLKLTRASTSFGGGGFVTPL